MEEIIQVLRTLLYNFRVLPHAMGLGVGQLLDAGRRLGDMSLVIGSIFLIIVIGIFVEKVFFSPLRVRTLKNRGLAQ